MFLAKMDTVLTAGTGENRVNAYGTRAWNAALITTQSRTQNKPGIGDALHILMHLAGMNGHNITGQIELAPTTI